MCNLVDKIERYLKKVLEETPHGYIIVQRSGLANQFDCAPSQINYVLSTRFTVEQGYLVESRRGGGGFLRIVKLGLNTRDVLDNLVGQFQDDELTQGTAEGLLNRLFEEGLITKREFVLVRSMVDRDTLALPVPERDKLRARLLAAVLKTLAREDI